MTRLVLLRHPSSLEHDTGSSSEASDFIDVNGDGLPDHVALDSTGAPRVQLNLGTTDKNDKSSPPPTPLGSQNWLLVGTDSRAGTDGEFGERVEPAPSGTVRRHRVFLDPGPAGEAVEILARRDLPLLLRTMDL